MNRRSVSQLDRSSAIALLELMAPDANVFASNRTRISGERVCASVPSGLP